jgi:hypothetical protein
VESWPVLTGHIPCCHSAKWDTRNTAAPKHHRSEGVTSPSWSSATLLMSSLNYLSHVLGLVLPVPKVVCELRESRENDSSVSDILRPDK